MDSVVKGLMGAMPLPRIFGLEPPLRVTYMITLYFTIIPADYLQQNNVEMAQDEPAERFQTIGPQISEKFTYKN